MLNSITFKTELREIITAEEVTVLFDNITSKYVTALVALSLFPRLEQLKKEVLSKTSKQRNAELSKLLAEIFNRKQEIKINMWETLSAIGNNKKILQNTQEKSSDLEQIIYEEEQIINVYEDSIRFLETKEKRIMSGKYQKINQIHRPLNKKISLKKQLETLKTKLLEISEKHDNCFAEFEERINELIANTILTSSNINSKSTESIIKEKIVIDKHSNDKSMSIENVEYAYDSDENSMHYVRSQVSKDFYLYEPNEEDPDDELIYQLLAQGRYEDGTINALLIETDYETDIE